jgi:hypothetical protein
MMQDGDLEEEIAMVELRIQQRRTDIIAEGRKVSTALQHAVTSPAAFALAAGAGFILGRITLGSHSRSGGSRLLSLFESVRGLISMVRAPALIWLTRLFRSGDRPTG